MQCGRSFFFSKTLKKISAVVCVVCTRSNNILAIGTNSVFQSFVDNSTAHSEQVVSDGTIWGVGVCIYCC